MWSAANEPAWRRLYKPDKEKFDDAFEWVIGGRTMRIHQAYAWASVDTVGLTVWDASLVLAKYVEHKYGPEGLVGKRAIELGSGCGVAGIAAAFLGAATTLTDWELVMPLLSRNAAENAPVSLGPLTAQRLKWGEDISELGVFDMVLGADLLYQSQAIVPLLSTMHTLSRGDSIILMSYEKHNEVPDHFWLHVRNYFEVAQVPEAELHPEYRHPKIDLFRLVRKALVGNPTKD
jgi:predicted nicotinamide N-methyase